MFFLAGAVGLEPTTCGFGEDVRFFKIYSEIKKCNGYMRLYDDGLPTVVQKTHLQMLFMKSARRQNGVTR